MEVSLIEERACERRESILVSQSIPSQRELSSIDLVTDDDKKEKETCEHFTIRGFVAGIRKTDAKICWPFFKLQNHKSDDYANLFPPLPVTIFRRWNCENCQHKTDSPAVAVPNEALFNSQNDEVKGINTSLLGSTIMASHSDQKILLSDVQQLSEEKILEGQLLVEVDSSISVSNGECRPSICPAMKENESVIKDLTREGCQIPKASHDSYEEIQNQPRDRPTSVATEGRACPGERTFVQTTNTSGTADGEDAPDIVLYAKSKGTELVHEITDSEKAADLTFMGNDVAKPGKKQHNDVTRHVHDMDPLVLDENDHDASDSDMGLTEYTAQCEKHASEVLISEGKLQCKKARKVRLLDDIMRSEELDVMSKKVCNSNGDAEAGQIEDVINRRPDACKGKDQDVDYKSHLAYQKTKVEPIKSKERYIDRVNEDEGPSLMYWLKRATKKAMTHKGDAEIKHIDTVVVNSQPAADASSRKGLHLVHSGSEIKGNKSKAFVHRKQNEISWDHLIPQDIMTGKGLVAEDAATDNIHAKPIDSEFKGIIITGQTPHHSRKKIQDNIHKKAIVSKKKRKAPQVDGESSQTHLSKDSFGKHGHENITDFQGQIKVTKKRRTTRMCEKEALDDIPMDIVELLAKNQHERQMMDAKAATDTIHNLSEMPENMDSNGLNATEGHGNMVLDTTRKDLSQRKTLSSNIVNGLGSNRNADHSHSNGRQNSHMDLNKQDVIGASTGLLTLPQCRSQPMNCVQPPKFDSKNNYFLQSYSWSRARMPTSKLCHTDQGISGQNSGRNFHGRSPVLLKETPFRINPQIANAESNHMKNHCHDFLIQRKLRTVAHGTDNLKLVNQDDPHLLNSKECAESSIHKRTFPAAAHLLNSKECAESSIHKRTFTAATSFAEVGNPLYPNEIIPATHLLRLMDSATWSGASLHELLDINQIGFIQESDFYSNDQCYELTGLEGRVKTSQAPKHPLTVEHPDQGQHYGYSSKPLCPLPRIGVFGSLLQKEIATQSNNCGTQFGFKIGHSNGSKSRETNGKKKSKWPQTATHTRILNAQTPISRNENIRHMSNNRGTQLGLKIRHSNESKSCETNGKKQSECSQTATRTRLLNARTPISRNENIEQLFSAVDSIAHPGCSLARDDIVQVNINSEEATVQPLKNFCEMEICVINRNPADFTILDEDNEYMIASEDLRTRHITPSENLKYPNHTDGQKRQKLMKLTPSIGLVRS